MAQCEVCHSSEVVWKKVLNIHNKFVWELHDKHKEGKEFAYQTTKHSCPWKVLKRIPYNKRPDYLSSPLTFEPEDIWLEGNEV